MPEITYGMSAYQRDRGDLPELPLVNMLVEKSKSDQKGVVLLSRPGMTDVYTLSGSSVEGIYTKDGLFEGALFSLAGNTLHREDDAIGPIDGSEAISFASTGDDEDYDDQILIARGGNLWIYDDAGLDMVSFPDDLEIIAVGYLAGRFIALTKGSQRFYWSAVGNGRSWDGLDFASAEKEPDALRELVVLNDLLVLIGSETTEFWQVTNDADLPFSPITGRVFNKGCAQSGAAVNFDNTAAWVSSENIVYMFDGNIVPRRISDNGIEERIEASASVSVFAFFWEGHELLAVRLDGGTWLFDASTGQWCEFQTGGGNWLAQCESAGYFGSADASQIVRFGSQFTDLGISLERRFRGGFPLSGGNLAINNVRLRVNSGQTPILSGEFSDPVVQIRTSRDAGETWGKWRSTKLGVQGQYRRRVEWRALGIFDDPGFLSEYRVTDPVDFRVSGVAVNEKSGGRSR